MTMEWSNLRLPPTSLSRRNIGSPSRRIKSFLPTSNSLSQRSVQDSNEKIRRKSGNTMWSKVRRRYRKVFHFNVHIQNISIRKCWNHATKRRWEEVSSFLLGGTLCLYLWQVIVMIQLQYKTTLSLRSQFDTSRISHVNDSIHSQSFAFEFAFAFKFEFPSFQKGEGTKILPDYGSITYEKLPAGFEQRYVLEEVDRNGHVFRNVDFEDGNDDSIDVYYAYDDDYVKHPKCRRLSWHQMYHPSCNAFHEMDLQSISYMDHGHYRDVWTVSVDDEGEIEMVLKSKRFRHAYNMEHYEFTRMDALVMERLTSSPSIVDIYGHCAMSVFTESLPTEFESTVISGEGTLADNPLQDEHDVDPKNDFSPIQKLTLALHMAEAVAELHGFQDGVIVHDDIQLCQFLYDKHGRLKLNDFNRAEIMLWDEHTGNYCKYQNGPVYGNYRAPEEFRDDLLDEKIDVYSLGNNFYGLLTGLWVFYDEEDDSIVQERMIAKEQAYIDPRYRTRSFAEGALVKIIERCWAFDPEQRADVFEVVTFLRKALQNNPHS